MLHVLMGHDAEAVRYADFASAQGWPAAVVPLPFIRAQVATRAGRLAEAMDFLLQGFPSELRGGGAETLVLTVRRAIEDPGARNLALQSLRRLMTGPAVARVFAAPSMPMIAAQWAVRLGDMDLAYLAATRGLDHFERQGAVPFQNYLAPMWIPELLPFRQDPRFASFAARLRLPAYWERHGPPDRD
jgi:hypothetical protein